MSSLVQWITSYDVNNRMGKTLSSNHLVRYRRRKAWSICQSHPHFTYMQEWFSRAWRGYTDRPRPYPGGRWSRAPLVVIIPWTSLKSSSEILGSWWRMVSCKDLSSSHTDSWMFCPIRLEVRVQSSGSLHMFCILSLLFQNNQITQFKSTNCDYLHFNEIILIQVTAEVKELKLSL